MSASPDKAKLACLNSNGSIMVFNTKSFQTTHFFPNVFRKGESVASFCFSPDAAKLFILGSRNGYFIASVGSSSDMTDPEQEAAGDPHAESTPSRKRPRRQPQRNIRSVRNFFPNSKIAGGMLHCTLVVSMTSGCSAMAGKSEC